MALPEYVSETETGALIEAFVQPKASKDAVAGRQGRALKLKVKAPPLDDRANRAVEELLADALRVPVRRVAIVSGRASRYKRIAVSEMSAENVSRQLELVLSCRAHELGREALGTQVESVAHHREEDGR